MSKEAYSTYSSRIRIMQRQRHCQRLEGGTDEKACTERPGGMREGRDRPKEKQEIVILVPKRFF